MSDWDWTELNFYECVYLFISVRKQMNITRGLEILWFSSVFSLGVNTRARDEVRHFAIFYCQGNS